MACTCGHSIEEHGGDAQYPGWKGCWECKCIAYEEDREEEAALSAAGIDLEDKG